MTGVRLLDNWSPPDGAGAPVACLATTFTFEAEFFVEDCLSRFLSLSTVRSETTDRISSIAAVLEEEDRLSEAQVTVLVDRSSGAEKRNLRWDLLPVAAPGGLLHAKVAVLLWERSARIIVGSANLTPAGYRRQVELALAIDLDQNCRVPRRVLEDLVGELRHLTNLAPGAPTGPKGRALTTVALLESRMRALELPRASTRDLRLAVAPARPGLSPLDRLADVWHGAQPLRATVLSPFWDDATPAPAVEAIRRALTGRPATRRELQLVVAIDPYNGTVHAPPSLASQVNADVVVFDPPDGERRNLHAKLLVLESDDWVAALIGSSNATQAGYGLDRQRGHHELNMWLGCPARSHTAKKLRALARAGREIDLTDEVWESDPDEDEPTAPVLPLGFVRCTIDAATPPGVSLELDAGQLPAWWKIQTPAGHALLDDKSWRASGTPFTWVAALPDKTLPAYLVVHWSTDGGWEQASWTANVEDRSMLPPPDELADLPVDLLLAALASTRPLPVALEHELRRRERGSGAITQVELDPLRRFDDSGLLLQRARHISLALWRLQDRLGRPVSSLDALHWRLYGAFGPLAIADALTTATNAQTTLPGEAHFLLAELALTVAAVDWSQVPVGIDPKQVRSLVANVLAAIEQRRMTLPAAPDAALENYATDALKAARR